MQGWLFLSVAIVFEVAGTVSMRLAEGFTKPTPSILIFIFYGISMACVTVAMKTISLSVSYAIWSAVGTALIALISYFYFKEAFNTLKVVSLILIIAGVVGLNLGGTAR